MEARQPDRLVCSACGYEQWSDAYAFLHNDGHGPAIRYVSDWSRMIYRWLKEKILAGEQTVLQSETVIRMIDYTKKKFVDVGTGTLTLDRKQFTIRGTIRGEAVELAVPIAGVPTLPFKPGKYLEVQQGSDIYRCALTDGRLVMKFINMVKIFHELSCKKD